MIALQKLQATAKETQRNQEAESSYVRKLLWGQDPDQTAEADEMGNTILGDVTNPAPIVIQEKSTGFSPIALGLALMAGASIPTAGLLGVGAYFAAKALHPPAAQSEPASLNDESVNIGLRKFDPSLLRPSTTP